MFTGPFFDLDVCGRRNGGAVNEKLSVGPGQEGAGAVEDAFHGFIVGDNSDDDVRVFGDVR